MAKRTSLINQKHCNASEKSRGLAYVTKESVLLYTSS